MRAKLSDLQSIPQVVAEMTLDEKLDMVGCYRACHTRPIPDMDVPAIYLMDGATGLNGTHVVWMVGSGESQMSEPAIKPSARSM